MDLSLSPMDRRGVRGLGGVMTHHQQHLVLAGAVADGGAAPVARALAAMFETVPDGRDAHLGRDVSAFVAGATTESAWTTVIARDAR